MNDRGWKNLQGKFVLCKRDWGDDLTGIKAGTTIPVIMEVPKTNRYEGGYRIKHLGVHTTIPKSHFSEPLDKELIENPNYGEF